MKNISLLDSNQKHLQSRCVITPNHERGCCRGNVERKSLIYPSILIQIYLNKSPSRRKACEGLTLHREVSLVYVFEG